MRKIALALAAAALATACKDAPRPVPPGEPSPTPGRFKPMTSRDGQAVAPSAMPGPAQELPPGHPPLDTAPSNAPPLASEAVSGTVALSPKLKGRQGQVLYIVARNAANGQIVAVRKEDAVRFPVSFRISGADAMTAGTPFVGPFDITARLSKTGDAMPGAGDVEGTVKGVAPGAENVTVTLDTVRQ